jgi:hypothetical protein
MPLLPPVTMTFTRRSSSVSASRAVDLGEAIDLEHDLLCDFCKRSAVGQVDVR